MVYAVAFSPDGRTLVAGGGDGVLYRWDTSTWEPAGEPIVFDGGIWDTAWIDVSTLAVATDAGVQFVDPATTEFVQPPLAAHDGITYRVVSLDDGATLVTSGEDGFIRFWDLATRAPTRPALHPHAAGARVDLAPEAARMVSSSDDGTTALWDLRGGSSQATPLAERPNGRTQIVTSADGRIFTGDRNGEVREWRLDGTAVADGAPWSDVPISGLAVSDDGSRLAIARDGGTAQVFDVASGAPLTSVLPVGELTSAVALDPSGRHLVTVQGDHDCTSCFVLHDLDDASRDPRPFRSPGLGPDRTVAGAAAVFDPTGTVLVTGDRIGWVDAWDVATGDHRWGVQLPRGVRSLAFSPDGTRVAVGGNTGMLLELDANTGERRQQLDGHAGPVVTVAYAPDGALLASASSQDHELRVWRLDLGLTVGRPIWLGFDGSATVAWTEGGRRVVAPHLLAGAMVFDLDADRSVEAACRLAGRNLTLDEWQQYFGADPYRSTCSAYPTPDASSRPSDGPER
ncbi:MAG: WD40 repeat domain-containing protein [Ilumatobacteraceae bacterium]